MFYVFENIVISSIGETLYLVKDYYYESMEESRRDVHKIIQWRSRCLYIESFGLVMSTMRMMRVVFMFWP
jgi:hypothetical protein